MPRESRHPPAPQPARTLGTDPGGPAPPREAAQAARCVLMVRPAAFGWNPDTAASNAFQARAAAPGARVHARALAEFDAAQRLLADAGAQTIVVEDTPLPVKPDAIFPNNWASFHGDGTVVLYPLLAASRRPERRPELIREVERQSAFRLTRLVDLSGLEAAGEFLEGTGSLVLDRRAGWAYAAMSPRTTQGALAAFARQTGIGVTRFASRDAAGLPVYHTNVLMSLGSQFAVVCLDAVVPGAQREALRTGLEATGRQIVELSQAQMASFAGNMLELSGTHGPFAVLSGAALRSLHGAQRRALERCVRLWPVELETIERYGGGSIRCMLTEIFVGDDGPARGGRG